MASLPCKMESAFVFRELRVGEGVIEENSSWLKFEKYLWAPIRNYCHLLRIKALD